MPDYRKAARRAARRHGVNPTLFERQIGAESNFNPRASSGKAFGIAQFTPPTARGMGVNLNDGRVSDDLDGAARLMASYIRKYGSYEKALRAYNAGPGAIERSRGYAETNAYVKKILRGGNPKGAVSPSRGGAPATPGTPDRTLQVPTSEFDAPGFEAARRQSILAGYLQRNNPRSGVLGILDAKPPSAADFTRQGTQTLTIPGTPGTPARGGGGGGGRGGGSFFQLGGGYKGTKAIADRARQIGEELGLQVTSEKRNNTNPHSGSRSDHDFGNKDAFAYDLSNGSRPTPEMDRAAYRLAKKLGIRDYKLGQPIMRTVQRNGVRVQIIYRGSGAAFGGNHMDHIHIGVKNVRGGGGRDRGVVR